MDFDHVATTTRAVRKRLDLERPVEPEVIEECIDIALQAPTGSNAQGWRFLVVTDADKRAKLAELYLSGWNAVYGDPKAAVASTPAEKQAQQARVLDSADHLANHLHEVPVHVIPCILGKLDGGNAAMWAGFLGSIFPAVWSFQMALRSRGLGSVLTTLHLFRDQEAAEILGIPDTVTQAALIPVAYTIGTDFKPAKRRPARELTYWDSWKATR